MTDQSDLTSDINILLGEYNGWKEIDKTGQMAHQVTLELNAKYEKIFKRSPDQDLKPKPEVTVEVEKREIVV